MFSFSDVFWNINLPPHLALADGLIIVCSLPQLFFNSHPSVSTPISGGSPYDTLRYLLFVRYVHVQVVLCTSCVLYNLCCISCTFSRSISLTMDLTQVASDIQQLIQGLNAWTSKFCITILSSESFLDIGCTAMGEESCTPIGST
jgi:hypothetical protein